VGWHILVIGLSLAFWATERCARNDDRGGTAVVTDREVKPVREKSILWVTEHASYVGGVLLGGVEVGVVTNHLEGLPSEEVTVRRRK